MSPGTTSRRTLLVLACALCACATTSRPDPIASYLEQQRARLHLPGLAAAIIHDGKVVHARGYGHADLEHAVPVTTSTVFELGSLTKQFTALAVLLLAEDGRLRLDDSIATYLDDAPPDWQARTIRHLLQHTSGIQNHVAVPGYLHRFKTSILGEQTPSRDDLVRAFYALPLEFAAGASWSYDNTGYYLLGLILERVSGTTFWELLSSRILGPAAMSATRSTDAAPIVPQRARGYVWTGKDFRNQPVLPPFVALSAGALMSTLEDLIRWDAALANGRLVTPAIARVVWTPAVLDGGAPLPIDYGMGWFVDSFRGRRVVQHSGGTPGFSSTIYRFVDDRLTIIVLANHADRMLDQLAIDLAGLTVPALRRSAAASDPDPRRTESLAGVVRALLQGQPPGDRFTPAMRAFLATASGRALWQWYAEHGALTAFEFSEQEAIGDDLVVRFRVTLGSDGYWLSVRLSPDGAISQIRWW